MNQRTRLDGQVAFVTGGGGGIGHGIALGLAEADARVAVFEIFPERAEETAAEIRALGGEALALPGDAMSGAALKQAIAATDAQCESAQTGGDDDRHPPADRRRNLGVERMDQGSRRQVDAQRRAFLWWISGAPGFAEIARWAIAARRNSEEYLVRGDC